MKPCLLQISDNSRKDYIVNILKNRESAIYHYNITKAGRATVSIPAEVLARVILCNDFVEVKVKCEDVLCPKSIDSVNESLPYVMSLEKNIAAHSVLKTFPYQPL